MAGRSQWAPTPGEVVYAGFWTRVAAFLIDTVVASLLIAIVLVPAYTGTALLLQRLDSAGKLPDQAVADTVLAAFATVAAPLLWVAYFALLHASRRQATPGKRAVGIKLVRGNGAPLALPRAVGRALLVLASFNLTAGLAQLLVIFSPRRRGLQDMACDTVVVDRWAFTPESQRQRAGMGAVAKSVLAVAAVLLALNVVAAARYLIGALAAG